MTYFAAIPLHTLAWSLFVIAFAGMGFAWVFCRQPGQRLMVFLPIWRAREALTPLGVWLWWGFYPLGLVAAVLLIIDILGR